MRHFYSYGPVDCEEHFCVSRKGLIKECFTQLIGNPEKIGHYFTIWAPRQTGKTWLMRQVKKEIENQYSDKFVIGVMSMQGVILEDQNSENEFLLWTPKLIENAFGIDIDIPADWNKWTNLFHSKKGIFKKPVILFIDEFDSLPHKMIDRLVMIFRDIYLNRENYLLHGMALIGVRAVLGVESERGSPFNIQRSLHVPNFTREEVQDLYNQYQSESRQKIEPEVIESVYKLTRGQPGLVCWFGELLTEKYNPGSDKIIDMQIWKQIYSRACYSEWNNTVLNLIKKVRAGYQNHVIELFNRSDIRFSIDADWCSYLYLNGVIDKENIINERGEFIEICRFSNPFIQLRLYNALTMDLIGDRLPILALEPLDKLSDVFDTSELNIPALLERYKNYLNRLKAKGINTWKDQPRRADLHYTEYVGHFHLYFWLQEAIGNRCSISPEFPTGNGRVDLHLWCKNKQAVIEVKSFKNQAELANSMKQAVKYAQQLKFPKITIAVFVPVEDEETLNRLSGKHIIDGITVTVVAIGWI